MVLSLLYDLFFAIKQRDLGLFLLLNQKWCWSFFFLIRIRNKAKKNTAHLGLPDRTKSPLVWLLGSHLFGWYQVLNIKSKWIDLGENPLKSQFTLLSNAGTWHKNGHFWMCWVTRVYVLSCVLKYRIQVNPFYFLNRLK